MYVICDTCKKKFKVDLKTQKIKSLQGVEEICFFCKHCKQKYHVSYQNKTIKVYQKRIQRLKELCNKESQKEHNTETELKQLLKDNTQRLNTIRNLQTRLKKEQLIISKKVREINGKQ